MTALTPVGLPSGRWLGTARLVFRRTAWFGDGASLVGLFAAGLDASPCGWEWGGDLPPVRPGQRLEAVDGEWTLEGWGRLEGLPRAAATLSRVEVPSAEWKAGWRRSLPLPLTEEGVWLDSLWDGPAAWRDLVGRGSGSTPLGDDYVAGWFAARQALGHWTAADREALLRAARTTSSLSRHYLEHLAEGRVDAAVAAFLSAPLPEPGDTRATALLSRGHLSGCATVVGLVAGLTAGPSGD